MRSLVKLGLTLSLLGGAVLSSAVVRTPTAMAIPEADALKRLDPVPVFAVANQEGVPILGSVPNPKDKTKQVQFMTFYMSQQDAQGLVTMLKTQKPDIGKNARVVTLSMRQAYDIKNKNKDKAETLVIEFQPTKQQVEAAVAVLKQNGKSVKEFNDIPLFYAIGGTDKGLLTIEQGKNKVIPFYFNKQDLQGMLDQLKQKDPKLSSSTTVQVTSLSQIVGALLKDNSTGIQQITLVPDRTSLEYALQQQKAAGGNKPAAGGKPSTSPSAPAPGAPAPSAAPGVPTPSAAPGAPAPQAQPSSPSKPK
jgi:Tic22-like family